MAGSVTLEEALKVVLDSSAWEHVEAAYAGMSPIERQAVDVLKVACGLRPLNWWSGDQA